jgi:hypothetical protein
MLQPRRHPLSRSRSNTPTRRYRCCCSRTDTDDIVAERPELPPVGSHDDATGTVSGKGGGMLRRSAKSKRPGNQRRLIGTDAELGTGGRDRALRTRLA